MEALAGFQSDIEARLVVVGFQRERKKYTPHITIGQDLVFREDFRQVVSQINLKKIPVIEVSKIQIFKSEQISNKRVYTPIVEYELLEKK